MLQPYLMAAAAILNANFGPNDPRMANVYTHTKF